MKKDITNDLTQGKVSQQLIRYATPLVSTSILQSLYSIVDLLIAGWLLGSYGISAINNSGQITTIITNITIGLSIGGNILIGQYFGKKDKENQDKAISSLISLFFIMGIGVMVILFLGSSAILHAMRAPAYDEALVYLKVCSFGMFFIFGYNALATVLRAIGNSKKPFHFMIVSTVVNIALDLLFMGYLKMGTAGAAWATVIAQVVSFILALFFLLKHKGIWNSWKIYGNQVAMIFKLGIPIAIQRLIAGLSFLVVSFLINGYGVDVSAGNGISVKIRDFSMLFLHAIANSCSTMAAQNLGAQLYDRTLEVEKTAIKISMATATVIVILAELFAPFFVGLFTNDANVIAAGVLNMRIEILGQLFYAMFLVQNALATGAGHTVFILCNSCVNCLILRAPLAILFNMLWGLPGVYIACALAPASSAIIGHIYVKSGKWKRSLVKA